MKDLPLDIISFAERQDLLNEQRLSVVQKTILKALYGLPLSDAELEIYQSGTARVAYEQREQNEMTLIAGRRGGKTTIAAIIAIYEACRKHGLPPGEQGCVMLLASTIQQSGMAFKYIVNYFRRSLVLDSRCVKIKKSEILLDNGVVIACHPSSHHGVRGRSIIAVICDEIAFWPYGEEAANPAGEILNALRPAMATLCNTKIIKISTPFAKAGILWDEYQRRSELDYAVWQATTFEMNPSVTPEKVKRQRCQNEEEYQREYLAEFTESINSWIDSEILDPCIVRGRQEIPPNPEFNYVAAIDPASRGHNFALVILHATAAGTIVVDKVACWTGTRKAPLPFEYVLGQIREILRSYSISEVVGDQFYCDAIGQHLLRLGILYDVFQVSKNSRTSIFSGLKHLIVQNKIEILDNPNLVRELRNLREERGSRGDIDIRPMHGSDDTAFGLALAANKVVNLQSPLPFDAVPVQLVGRCRTFDPETCLYHAACQNSPACLDTGVCRGFRVAA